MSINAESLDFTAMRFSVANHFYRKYNPCVVHLRAEKQTFQIKTHRELITRYVGGTKLAGYVNSQNIEFPSWKRTFDYRTRY